MSDTTGPAAIPPQAITDHTGRAVMAIRQHLINNGCTVPVAVVAEALEAAAPHLAAAERERCARRVDDLAAQHDQMDMPGWARELRKVAALLREQP